MPSLRRSTLLKIGNGRVGRALIYLVLRRRGLPPRYIPPISLVLATESRNYIGGLTAYRYAGALTSLTASQGLPPGWQSLQRPQHAPSMMHCS